VLLASRSSLVGVVPRERGGTLHGEQPTDDSKAFERDLVA